MRSRERGTSRFGSATAGGQKVPGTLAAEHSIGPSVPGTGVDDSEISAIIDFFSNCRTKQQILDGMLEFARGYFGCVSVYSVRGQVIEKVAAMCDVPGPNSTPNGRITIFKRCVMSGRPYLGPIPVVDLADPKMVTLVSILPERCWAYPMAISDQIDCLFFAEVPKIPVAHCTERFEFLINKVTLALRRLLIEQLLLK